MATSVAPLPRGGAVLREQVRAVGLSLRHEAIAAAAVMAMLTVVVCVSAAESVGDGEIRVAPGGFFPMAVVALLFPLAIWKGAGPAARQYHRAMPADFAAHAAARCAAGLAWLLAGTAAYGGWLLVLGALTGGGLDRWNEPWRWAAPAAAIVSLYLLGSAVALVAEHPWRWLTAAMLYVVAYIAAGDEVFGTGASALLAPLDGRMGLFALAMGIVPGVHGTLTFGEWLPVAWTWLGMATAAFAAAAWRQRAR